MRNEEIVEMIRKKYERVSAILDERGRRVWALAEAQGNRIKNILKTVMSGGIPGYLRGGRHEPRFYQTFFAVGRS
ncbi:MAG: hypothetical protein ACRD82_24250, partial [Blastocatellia bacterium]